MGTDAEWCRNQKPVGQHGLWVGEEGAEVQVVDGATRKGYLTNLDLIPVRAATAYAYGLNVDSDEGFFIGGANTKSYQVYIAGSRPVGYAATGDSNDALLRFTSSNYAVNDANFIWRGMNGAVNNRAGGTLGIMEHSLGAQNKGGGTAPTIRVLSLTAENYGVCGTEFGVLALDLRNEGAVATTEYGCRVRNTNNSLGTAVGAAYLATKTGANIGFNYGLDLYGSAIQKAALRDANEVCQLSGAGVPSDGTTGAAFAQIGSSYADLTNGNLYLNAGTKTSPVWKLVTRAA